MSSKRQVPRYPYYTLLGCCLLLLLTFPVVAFNRRVTNGRYFAYAIPSDKGIKLVSASSITNQPRQHHDPNKNVLLLGSTDQDSNLWSPNTFDASRPLIAAFALSTWGLLALAAKFGVIPGPAQPDGSYLPYSDALIWRDIGATILTGALGYGLVKGITRAATSTDEREAILKPRDSRKLIHLLSATGFILFWPVFSDAAGAKYFAASVPCINALRLYLAASGESDSELVAAVSRSGNRMEAAGGPLIYVIIMATAVLAFWREDPAGVVALSTMAAGDGLADLIGRRYGKSNPWPAALTGPNNRKSVAGSLALVVASVLTSAGLLLWLQQNGCLLTELPPTAELFTKLTIVAICAAIIELVPIMDDNYTVPIGAAILASVLL